MKKHSVISLNVGTQIWRDKQAKGPSFLSIESSEIEKIGLGIDAKLCFLFEEIFEVILGKK